MPNDNLRDRLRQADLQPCIVRSAHVTPAGIALSTRIYVVGTGGARLYASPDITAAAINALWRHVEMHEQRQREAARKVRRAA